MQSQLFVRILSQMLQGTLAIAFALAWARQRDRRSLERAMRWACFLALPATPLAAWLFSITEQQARWEATLAGTTLAAVIAIAATEYASAAESRRTAPGTFWMGAMLAAATILIVRQTMEIGVVLRAALSIPGSQTTLIAIGSAVAIGLAASGMWARLGRSLSPAALAKATHVFLILFVIQLTVYGVHEAAEARLLPWSEPIHVATESYGPDSTFGAYATILLLVVPAAVAAATMAAQSMMTAVTAVGVSAAVIAMATVVVVSLDSGRFDPGTEVAASGSPVLSIASRDAAPFLGSPHMLFRHARRDAEVGRVGVARLDSPDGGRAVADLACARVSFGADRGLCIAAGGTATEPTYRAVLFDAALRPIGSLPLEGAPSRTRTSADGRFGATTMFVRGASHGYDGTDFSTITTLFDLQAFKAIANLEEFAAFRAGARFKSADFNYWGVTFSTNDSNTFYATLRTGRNNFLVRGSIADRTVSVIAEDVECPSLSPDDRLIAFKRRESPMPMAWRLHVLDLSTMEVRRIPSVRQYVDDQVEWLDASNILYAMPHLGTADVWVAPVEAGAPARVLVHDADSPIVVRPAHSAAPIATPTP